MNPRAYLATTRRVGLQLFGDHRTIALILAVPVVLLSILYFLYRDLPPLPPLPGQPRTFDRIAITMLGVLPMLVMFLVTSVAMLRERVSGTLERLMTTPIRRADLVGGYATAFAITSLAQSLVLCAVTLWLFDVRVDGPVALVIMVAVLSSAVGMALGLLTSAFARTEFQAVQFMPLVIGPQVFLCGLLVARSQMPDWLRIISDALPMSYAVEALGQVSLHSETTRTYGVSVGLLALFALLSLAAAAATLRRKSR